MNGNDRKVGRCMIVFQFSQPCSDAAAGKLTRITRRLPRRMIVPVSAEQRVLQSLAVTDSLHAAARAAAGAGGAFLTMLPPQTADCQQTDADHQQQYSTFAKITLNSSEHLFSFPPISAFKLLPFPSVQLPMSGFLYMAGLTDRPEPQAAPSRSP